MQEIILSVSGITKSFSGIKALDNVQLTLRKGEVHALMGENGAGKSTFMKILSGMLHPDSGEIYFENQHLKNSRAGDTLKKNVTMIHQEILMIPELTVAQNIFLGREREVSGKRWGLLDDRSLNARAVEIMEQMGLAIRPDTKVKQLSVSQMQMVEIAKAISNDARVMIMDEPTSAISDKEVKILFDLIKVLKEKGVAIVYISHKMEEIFQISDTITVLRDGKYIDTRKATDLDRNSLISMMVGREISNMFPESVAEKGKQVLSVRNLTKKGQFSGITFDVHAGEILGISGLMGAGRTEIARSIFGLDTPDSGEVYVNGQKTSVKSPRDAIKLGIGYVSEDRKGLGFIPGLSVKENITLSSLDRHRRGIFIDNSSETGVTSRMIADLRIKSSGMDQKVTYLSGGNQQKVVLGRVLLASPEIIILDEPTRGVDVGAKFEIYKLISGLAGQGIAVIMISSELPEILGMSDRILVLSKGKQTALLSRQEATQETIMKYAVE